MQKKIINNPLKLLIFFALISFSGIAQVTRTIELEAVDIVSDIIPTLTIGEKTFIMKKIELNDEKFDDLYLQRQWKRMGLTKAGVNINATTWANALRQHLPTSRQTSSGLPILRQANSFSNGQVTPIWVIDEIIMDEPPGGANSVQEFGPRITKIRVLSSLAETTRYGQLGRAGVIIISTQ